MRLTERDGRVLTFVGDQYGAPLSVVARLYAVGDRAARQYVARLERAGLAGRVSIAGRQWVTPTTAGLRFAGLEYDQWTPRLWKLEHVEGVGRLRLDLAAIHPYATWTSERAIRSRWAGSGARVRFADGQLDLPDGRCVGVELELHRKPARLYEGIGRDVDPAFDEVWWFCPAAMVGWLGEVLAGLVLPARPVHVVRELPAGAGS